MDPLTMTLIGGAVGAGANAIFGRKKRTWKVEDLKQYGFIPYDAEKELANWSSDIYGKIAEQRANATAKAEQEGISAPTSAYTSEAPLLDAFQKGKEQIDRTAQEEQKRIAEMLMSMNMQEEQNTPSTMQNLFGGFVTGANVTSGIMNTAESLKPDKPAIGGGKDFADNLNMKNMNIGDADFMKQYQAYKSYFGKRNPYSAQNSMYLP